MEKDVKKEIARDVFALGSWVVYIIVIIVALIEPFRPLVDQLLIAGILILLIEMSFKHRIDGYTSRTIALALFSALFFQNLIGTYLVAAIAILLIYTSHYVENTSKQILIGLAAGVVAVIGGYFGTALTMSF